MVRYADDSIFCFQYAEDALRFYRAFINRLDKFGLEILQEKTKIIRLNKDDEDSGEDDNGSSFDFLGFTHYVGRDKNGRKRVKRKTSKKKYKASLLRCKEWMKRNEDRGAGTVVLFAGTGYIVLNYFYARILKNHRNRKIKIGYDIQ